MTVWLVEGREGRGLKEVPQVVLLPSKVRDTAGVGPSRAWSKKSNCSRGSRSVVEAWCGLCCRLSRDLLLILKDLEMCRSPSFSPNFFPSELRYEVWILKRLLIRIKSCKLDGDGLAFSFEFYYFGCPLQLKNPVLDAGRASAETWPAPGSESQLSSPTVWPWPGMALPALDSCPDQAYSGLTPLCIYVCVLSQYRVEAGFQKIRDGGR